MKLSRKLIPAFAMLLVSAIMLTTASYAWFSINTEVKVDGMSVKTTASDSVLIVGSALDATAKADDATFTTDLTQTVSGLLNPVSTVNGTAFFYTDGKNVEGDGDAKTEDYEAYDAANTEDFNGDYDDPLFSANPANNSIKNNVSYYFSSDTSVNTVTLNIYSYSDETVVLKILSKAKTSQAFIESAKMSLKKGWNKIEIPVTAFNCDELGKLTTLRFNLDLNTATDIAIGEIAIGG